MGENGGGGGGGGGGWIDSEGFILLVRIQRRRQCSSLNAAQVSGNLRKL